ncbi:hypothetical protein BGW38_009738, partial [Lunasporangiospora selenospora]
MSNSMLPPDSKPSAEKKDKAGGLSQDDFRKLLATPRAAPGEAKGIGGTFSRTLGSANRTARVPVPQTPHASDSNGSHKSKQKKSAYKQQAKEASAAASKYRDRAMERRQGINPDYAETEQILSTLESSELAADDMYEQSKFLGGDREHTHLVKGLDYTLLDKVRQEGSDKGSDSMDLDKVFESVEKITHQSKEEVVLDVKPEISSAMAANIFRYAIEEPKKKPPKVNEMFLPGRTVFLFELPITSKSKKPKTGVVEDRNPFAVPTAVVRSKAGVEHSRAGGVDGPEADLVMKKVMDVLHAIRTGERKKAELEEDLKAKRKTAMAAAAAAKENDEEKLPDIQPDEDGEDIFADAGRTYIVDPGPRSDEQSMSAEGGMDVDPEELGPTVGPERPGDIDMSNYFGEESDGEEEEEQDNADANLDGEAPILGPARPTEVDMSHYFGNDSDEDNDAVYQDEKQGSDEGEAATEVPAPSALMTSAYTTPLNENALPRRKPRVEDLVVDEDADYYSSYGLGLGGGNIGSTAYDSDDDEDEGRSTILMDQGTHKNKKAQLGRFDFDTEEGFNQYKDTIEVVPKTALQFGVKMSDGRRTG